jgi:hypothetical protein
MMAHGKKVCPLLSITALGKRCYNCLENECAWFDAQTRSCAVLGVFDSMDEYFIKSKTERLKTGCADAVDGDINGNVDYVEHNGKRYEVALDRK